jgi:hypothetical protein
MSEDGGLSKATYFAKCLDVYGRELGLVEILSAHQGIHDGFGDVDMADAKRMAEFVGEHQGEIGLALVLIDGDIVAVELTLVKGRTAPLQSVVGTSILVIGLHQGGALFVEEYQLNPHLFKLLTFGFQPSLLLSQGATLGL